jgi:transcriptional regulator MraZ
MLTHLYPWTGAADGGNFGSTYRAPLAERPWASVGGRSGMFLSTYVNKVDRKGRVSVPATFRASLAAQRFPGIVAFPSHKYPAINANGIDRMEELIARVGTLEEFSDEQENLAVLLFAPSQRLPFDTEGRIVLPADLAQHASIGDSAAFVGLGDSFQIWEPGRFAEHLASLRERARRQGTRIPPLGGSPDRRPND